MTQYIDMGGYQAVANTVEVRDGVLYYEGTDIDVNVSRWTATQAYIMAPIAHRMDGGRRARG